MASNNHYDGYTELKSYILSVKTPSFESFVVANQQKIAIWSLMMKTNSPDDFFEIWKRLFIRLIRIERPLLKIRACKKNTVIWNAIANSKNERNIASVTYLASSIRTLTALANDGSNLVIANQHKNRKRCFNDIEVAATGSSKDTIASLSKESISSSFNDTINSSEDASVTLLEVLFGMALKKLSSEAWNEEESRLLDQLDSPFIDINTTFCNLVKSILNKNGSDMDSSDLITLKLCLSRIVNLMNPKQAERVIRYLRIDDEKKQVRGSIDEFLKHSLNKDAHKAYDKILDVFETGSCLEDALIVIDALKKPLLERKERDTNMYRMLKIVEHVLGYLYACRDDDSEATVYR
ncbi:hypothetical protein CU097_002930 [Rhizopus azygosporus]|uniref:Uncharacterized protein n=1 Tax=Rhizopus azygosporus TaxID=86630 RepID=A0A367J1V1_RHIAZ|nr:hypothetical protein CU097_002930 [Rhizopus azygosporus]